MIVLPNFALIGKAGSGKSTVAEYLAKHFGYERLSFAGPLKVGCGTSTDRELLQRVGQGVRDMHPDFWVRLFLEKYYERASDTARVVVDDCRYPNEADALRREGFKFLRVMSRRSERVSRLRMNGKLMDESELEHESETALDGFEPDYTIWNNDTPAKLYHSLVDVLNRERA